MWSLKIKEFLYSYTSCLYCLFSFFFFFTRLELSVSLFLGLIWFGLVWFYGISTIVYHLMPNPFLYIKTVLFQTIQFSINLVFVYTQLNIQRVLFQTIQFSINSVFCYTQLNIQTGLFQTIQFNVSTQFKCQKQFYFKQFSFAWVQFTCETLLFDALIGPYLVLPLQARVDLAMKEYSAFLKAPALLESHSQIV